MDPDEIRIRLLGTVDVVEAGRPRAMAGLRRKAMLAALGLRVGHTVSTDELADIVWAGKPPASAENTLQHHVAYLRRILGEPAAIVTRRRGYALDVPPEVVDVAVAEKVIRAGTGGGPSQARAERLRWALALWRGRALIDVAELPKLGERADQIEALRLQGMEALVDVRMSLGEDALVVADLEALVEEHPLRESFYRLLMLALYRTGRQADALAVYARLRTELAEQIGLDPSPSLRALEAAILRQDPSLDRPATDPSGGAAAEHRSATARVPEVSQGHTSNGPTTAGLGTPDQLEDCLQAGERMLFEVGDLGAGRRSFDVAYRMAERLGDPTALARAALGLGGLWLHENRAAAHAQTVRARQQRAVSEVDPQSFLALRLRIRLAAEADFTLGQSGDILAMLIEARQRDHALALAEALRLAIGCVYAPGEPTQRLELANELIAVAARTDRHVDLLTGLLYRTVVLFQAGDLRAERSLAELRDRLAARDHQAVGFVVGGIDVMLNIRSGRLADAEMLAAANAQRGAAIDDPTAPARYAAQMATIRWYQGRIGELYSRLSELLYSPSLAISDDSLFPVFAGAAAAVGDRRLAATTLARLRGRGLARLPRVSAWLATLFVTVEVANMLGDADCADETYALLAPYGDAPVVGPLGVTCVGSAQHALGVAALTCGQLDRAVAHLQSAVRDNMALGHLPAAAMSRHRLGEALALRDGPDDARARFELAHAADEGAALGVAPGSQWLASVTPGR